MPAPDQNTHKASDPGRQAMTTTDNNAPTENNQEQTPGSQTTGNTSSGGGQTIRSRRSQNKMSLKSKSMLTAAAAASLVTLIEAYNLGQNALSHFRSDQSPQQNQQKNQIKKTVNTMTTAPATVADNTPPQKTTQEVSSSTTPNGGVNTADNGFDTMQKNTNYHPPEQNAESAAVGHPVPNPSTTDDPWNHVIRPGDVNNSKIYQDRPSRGRGFSCNLQKINEIFRTTCGLALTPPEVAYIMNARLLTSGRRNLRVISIRPGPFSGSDLSDYQYIVTIGSPDNTIIGQYYVSADTGEILKTNIH